MTTFIIFIIVLFCLFAYLRNIFRIIIDAKNLRGGMICARIIGIFVVPLGIVLGAC